MTFMKHTVTFIVVIVAKDGQWHWSVSRDVCQAYACRAKLVVRGLGGQMTV